LIKRNIILGDLKSGDKLESVRDYAAKLKVNPNTVQKAYQEMERDGLAYSRRGIGRFIIEEDGLKKKLMDEVSSHIIEEYIHKMRELGYEDKDILKRLDEMIKEV
jgi:DNA-binding transcriptional regulator YhcF (GntR family)